MKIKLLRMNTRARRSGERGVEVKKIHGLYPDCGCPGIYLPCGCYHAGHTVACTTRGLTDEDLKTVQAMRELVAKLPGVTMGILKTEKEENGLGSLDGMNKKGNGS